MNDLVKDVPQGNYCYGYVPKRDSGFLSLSEVAAHISRTYADPNGPEALAEHNRLLEPRYCKYWNPTENGYVECRYLNRKALWITTTQEVIDKAIAFFGSEEEMDKQITGFVLGDSVKECTLNRDGPDFAINSAEQD